MQFLHADKPPAIDETIGGDVLFDIARSPIDGNGACGKAVEDLFGDVTRRLLSVLITDHKLVVLHHSNLIIDGAAIALVLVGTPAASVKLKTFLVTLFKVIDGRLTLRIKFMFVMAFELRSDKSTQLLLFKCNKVWGHRSEYRIVEFEIGLAIDQNIIPSIDAGKAALNVGKVHLLQDCFWLPHEQNELFSREFREVVFASNLGRNVEENNFVDIICKRHFAKVTCALE